jgi:hypothetical protein
MSVDLDIKTVQAMIRLYCKHHHSKEPLCADCERLFVYAQARLLKCPLRDDKPSCQQCPIHCYGPEMRDAVAKVMRFSGPRMLFHHPLLALRHLWQSRKLVRSKRKV